MQPARATSKASLGEQVRHRGWPQDALKLIHSGLIKVQSLSQTGRWKPWRCRLCGRPLDDMTLPFFMEPLSFCGCVIGEDQSSEGPS